MTDAYKYMIKEFYAKDNYYENGVERIILEDEDMIPSIRQFRYWYQKEYNAPEVLKARKGEKRFNKDHRAVLSTSLSEVFGPGSRYQVDATIADCLFSIGSKSQLDYRASCGVFSNGCF